MGTPANLYPGLNDITDVLEEYPMETSRYLTLLHEIDAKCVHAMGDINGKIFKFLDPNDAPHGKIGKLNDLTNINRLFEELMPSLEEKMHVSSIMLESLEKLNERLESSYEVAIRNEEIPPSLRLGIDNHPAMHLHHELMDKIETKNGNKSSQAMKSESRREAMAANRKTTVPNGIVNNSIDDGSTNKPDEYVEERKRTNTNSDANKKRKRRAVTTTTPSTSLSNISNATGSITNAGHTGTSAAIAPNNIGSNSDSIQSGANRSSYGSSSTKTTQGSKTNEYGEPLYCYCNQVAYGEMVGCDGADCELEWFHLPCIGLETIPKGKWYCDDCKKRQKI